MTNEMIKQHVAIIKNITNNDLKLLMYIPINQTLYNNNEGDKLKELFKDVHSLKYMHNFNLNNKKQFDNIILSSVPIGSGYSNYYKFVNDKMNKVY